MTDHPRHIAWPLGHAVTAELQRAVGPSVWFWCQMQRWAQEDRRRFLAAARW